ncbi:MAG TPA: four-carbon acid sugar kinase family protein, partial [Pirellulaceae bacterium]|nr:four-carbon acid sugar kinase family protein [Pirellulaceae bacterium]
MAIVIIADDLSGAAELAGIAHAHGYVAEVHRDFDAASDAEVIAVDTDSRGLLPEAAADRVRQAAREILAAKPAWLFKKVDSLLRGNVRAEIEALLDATGQGQAVLIPANPSRGRTIVRGELRIDGVPLHETALAGEPQHPRRTSRVAELISGDSLPTESIDAPDVATAEELLHHAASYDDTTLAAGAADF